jgi:hypothetical protein
MSYPEDRWSWYASSDPENGYPIGPCATREAALDEAVNANTFSEIEPTIEQPDWTIAIHVMEGVRPEVSDMTIDGDDILQDLDENKYSDWAYEEPLFESVTKEAAADLSLRLTEALHAWAKVNEITFRHWMFVDTRNEERVLLPHPLEEPQT